MGMTLMANEWIQDFGILLNHTKWTLDQNLIFRIKTMFYYIIVWLTSSLSDWIILLKIWWKLSEWKVGIISSLPLWSLEREQKEEHCRLSQFPITQQDRKHKIPATARREFDFFFLDEDEGVRRFCTPIPPALPLVFIPRYSHGIYQSVFSAHPLNTAPPIFRLFPYLPTCLIPSN